MRRSPGSRGAGRADGFGFAVVERREDGAVLGTVGAGARRILAGRGRVEVGWRLAARTGARAMPARRPGPGRPWVRGNGARGDRRLHRAGNLRSQAVMRRIGMRPRPGAGLRASGAAGGASAAAAHRSLRSTRRAARARPWRDGRPMSTTGRGVEGAMRTIVYGVGAIGGTVAAALALAGQEVVGIARGAQLEAIRRGGLLAADAGGRHGAARFACVGDPAEIDFRADDAILLTMKTQDTRRRWSGCGRRGWRQPIFCVQNGVANERMALRRFANVHGVTVMMPAAFTVPGEVVAFVDAAPRHLRYRALSGGERRATTRRWRRRWRRPTSRPSSTPEVMASKYGKLLAEPAQHRRGGARAAAPTRRIDAVLRAEARGGAGSGRHRLARRRRRRPAARRADAAAGGRRASSGRRVVDPEPGARRPGRSRPTG